MRHPVLIGGWTWNVPSPVPSNASTWFERSSVGSGDGEVGEGVAVEVARHEGGGEAPGADRRLDLERPVAGAGRHLDLILNVARVGFDDGEVGEGVSR